MPNDYDLRLNLSTFLYYKVRYRDITYQKNPKPSKSNI